MARRWCSAGASDGNYLASDSSALLEHTRRLTFLEDGQAAPHQRRLRRASTTSPAGDQARKRSIWDITWQEEARQASKATPHYMAKEIHEQPRVLRRLAAERGAEAQRLADEIQQASTVHFVGCGSAAHAARCGEYLFSRIASRQANCVVGSEFGYLADFLDAAQPGGRAQPERRDDRSAGVDEGGRPTRRQTGGAGQRRGLEPVPPGRPSDPAVGRTRALRAGHQELHRQAGRAADGRLRRARAARRRPRCWSSAPPTRSRRS